MTSHSERSVPISDVQKLHLGYSGLSHDYTPCGRWVTEAPITYDLERVSCSDCAHEIALDRAARGTPPFLSEGGESRA